MRLAHASAVSVIGVHGHPVRIEAALLSGLPRFQIVGLPDAALSESKERVRAAFYAAGIAFPDSRVTVNLSPADTPKSGTGFDLAIAAAILAAVAGRRLDPDVYYLGELGLDGTVRPVRGVLPAALGARDETARMLVVPCGCAAEASLVDIDVREVWHLSQIAEELGLECGTAPEPARPTLRKAGPTRTIPDLADVYGQEEAKFALEVAAAGGHHMLMTGSPGVGKSMLAARMPGILPPLAHEHAVEVAAIASALGDFDGTLSTVAPFTAPHHTASATALVGGGPVPRPGAASRAHRGVLFLDELPEFSSRALQGLRQPMESGTVEIHRARMSLSFPARFQLVGAANPCACGNLLEGPGRCTCSVRQRRDYYRKIGGPIFDRIDISVVMRRLRRCELAAASAAAEATATVAGRVREARERQNRRYGAEAWSRNADVPAAILRRATTVPSRIDRMLDAEMNRGNLTMRGTDKILKVAWTIADLAGEDAPGADAFHQALVFRSATGVRA